MKQLIKRILRILFKDYQFNRIYFLDLPTSDPQILDELVGGGNIKTIESQEEFACSPDQQIRNHAWYLDQNAHVYGVYILDKLVCVCSYWTAAHPNIPTRFSKLKENEAIMVDLLTAAACRGKGYALAITRFSQNDLAAKGYKRLWTWVWHSNTPSIRVFEKAGWKYTYLLLEFQLSGMSDYRRIKLLRCGGEAFCFR
jgi:ribosomal protein S18 acetylase RimI-like enzyme